METKFTNGEWRFDNRNKVVFRYSDNEIKECELWPFQYENTSELSANGKLIASAPDLLAALEVCYASLCTYGNHPIIEKQVEAAIKKATE